MKIKLITISLALLASTVSFSQGNGNNGTTPADTNAQNNTRWKLNGNIISETQFIGTTNQKDVVFKSNNTEVLRLKPNKDFKIPGQIYMDLHRPLDPGKEKLLTVDYNGKVKSLEKSGLIQVLYGSACMDLNILVGGTPTLSTVALWDNTIPGVLYTGLPCNARIGIGTDNPSATLDVIGTGHFSRALGIGQAYNLANRLSITQGNPLNSGIVVNLTNTTSTNYTGVGLKVVTHNSGRKAMTIVDGATNSDVFQAYGSGLIKTYITDPDYAFIIHNHADNDKKVFEVMSDGRIIATELILTLNPFPDYVFDKDYKLLTISQLDNYIQNEKHLPNMPSAKEVDENGIGVAELQIKLVEKVEELALYIIELNKQLEELKKENKEIKTALNK